MTWNIGDQLELTLSGFAHDGRAVARPQNQPVVFTRGGLPGQRVLVELTAIKKHMAEGVTLRTLAPVPADMGGERPAACPHAAECGGCPWQGLPYAGQLEWKRRLVLDALNRIGKLNLPESAVAPVLGVPALRCAAQDHASTMNNDPEHAYAQWAYRNKMEFAFACGPQGKAMLGLRRRASHDIVEVTGCLLQSPRTMRVLAALRDLVHQSGMAVWDNESNPDAGLRFAVIREPQSCAEAEKQENKENMGTSCLVELITGPGQPEAFAAIWGMGQALLDGQHGVTGFIHSVRTAKSAVAYGEKTICVLGQGHLTENLNLPGYANPISFELAHNAFFQVNTAGTELLYRTAARMALGDDAIAQGPAYTPEKNGTCWDVYCGVGGLTLSLAPYFTRVLGLENMAPAVALARKNAAAPNAKREEKNMPPCRFETADASRLGEYFRRYGAPDLLCADPPRAGLDPKTLQAILQAKPAKLLMVSCDPSTLARDLAGLSPAYALEQIQPVDMFPQSPHVECVVTLKALPA